MGKNCDYVVMLSELGKEQKLHTAASAQSAKQQAALEAKLTKQAAALDAAEGERKQLKGQLASASRRRRASLSASPHSKSVRRFFLI